MALIVLFGKYAKGLFTPTLTLINAKTRVRISSFFDPQRGRVLRFEESGVEGLTAFYDLQIAQVSPSTLRAYLFREYLRLKGSAFAGDGLVLTEQSKLDLLSPKRGTS